MYQKSTSASDSSALAGEPAKQDNVIPPGRAGIKTFERRSEIATGEIEKLDDQSLFPGRR